MSKIQLFDFTDQTSKMRRKDLLLKSTHFL